LKLFANRETYIVNDVLGVTTGPPDIDHIRANQTQVTASAESLLSSRDSKPTLGGQVTPKGGVRKRVTKRVGFAPVPPPLHEKPVVNRQAVHLSSTDGLVVVSAFLPVHLHRSDDGEWSADWDYEMLLSMQTHLRVTRVGVVKWRGWHGNRRMSMDDNDSAPSPQAGVPVNERHKVEACLAPFNCVPVWVDPTLFGDM
jgi:trehalose 6-phosphate synthase/phosphatase